MNALFESVPDFYQPVAALEHGHNQIRKQLATLQNLPDGAGLYAKQAATRAAHYFEKAAPQQHHDDQNPMQNERRVVAPAANRLLSPAQPARLDYTMHQRRDIVDAIWSCHVDC